MSNVKKNLKNYALNVYKPTAEFYCNILLSFSIIYASKHSSSDRFNTYYFSSMSKVYCRHHYMKRHKDLETVWLIGGSIGVGRSYRPGDEVTEFES